MTLMTATRNGEILEIKLDKQVNKKSETLEKNILKFNGGDGMNGQGKILVAHHPKL